jgi:hypothetical protein
MTVTLKEVKNRINRVKELILKKISDDIKKKEKSIPTEEEVIKIYEKRRAEYEKYVAKLAKKQAVVAPLKSHLKKKSQSKNTHA